MSATTGTTGTTGTSSATDVTGAEAAAGADGADGADFADGAEAAAARTGRTGRVRALLARRGAVATAVALAAALVLCGLSAWSYADTRGDGALSYGKARDAALSAGQRGVARLNTVDSAHVERDLDGWLGVTTGPLHDQLTRTHKSDAAAMKASGTSTRGTVTGAAVTELDTRAGTAKLIATVQVRLTPQSGTSTTDRKRFEADLSRTSGGWRLAALTAVPVGAS
jgi:Mce-associated membrane protein